MGSHALISDIWLVPRCRLLKLQESGRHCLDSLDLWDTVLPSSSIQILTTVVKREFGVKIVSVGVNIEDTSVPTLLCLSLRRMLTRSHPLRPNVHLLFLTQVLITYLCLRGILASHLFLLIDSDPAAKLRYDRPAPCLLRNIVTTRQDQAVRLDIARLFSKLVRSGVQIIKIAWTLQKALLTMLTDSELVLQNQTRWLVRGNDHGLPESV